MERFRKPRQHFDMSPNPSHVTFDDGKLQRNIPWLHYNEARWDHDEPGTIRVAFSGWLVVVTGYNLGALFAAIEERTLLRLRAHPEFAQNAEREADSFATAIRFVKQVTIPPTADRRGSPQGELGLA